MKIRNAIPGDEHRLADIAARLFRQTYEKDNTPENMASYLHDSFSPAKQRLELEDPNVRSMFLEDEDQIVGYTQVRKNKCPTESGTESDSELSRIYVDASRHGKGFGSYLLMAALEAAKDNHSDVIWLGVFEINHRARSFYERNGFRVVGTQGFKVGDDIQRDLIMIRQLGAR